MSDTNQDNFECYSGVDTPRKNLPKNEVESGPAAAVPIFEVVDETADVLFEFPVENQDLNEEVAPVFEVSVDDESMEAMADTCVTPEPEDLFELDYTDQLTAKEMSAQLFTHQDEEAYQKTSPTLFDDGVNLNNPEQLGPLFDHSKFSTTEQGAFDLDKVLTEGEYAPLFVTEVDKHLSGKVDLLDAIKDNSEEGWIRRKEEEIQRRQLACDTWKLPLYKNVRLSLSSLRGELEGILLPLEDPAPTNTAQALILAIGQIQFSSDEIVSCARIDL